MASAEEGVRALQEEVQALGLELYRRCEEEEEGHASDREIDVGADAYLGANVGQLRKAMRNKRVELTQNIDGFAFEYVEPEGYRGAIVPSEYECLITRTIMTDPVLASDGLLYEARALQEWYLRELEKAENDATYQPVGVYRQPLNREYAYRQLSVQKRIDSWVRDVGENGLQVLHGRELLPPERKSWVVSILPLHRLTEIADLYDKRCTGLFKLLSDYMEDFAVLASRFKAAGLVDDIQAYTWIIAGSYFHMTYLRYDDPVDNPIEWLNDKMVDSRPMSSYPVDRMRCIVKKYRANLVREALYLRMSQSKFQTTDMADVSDPAKHVDFESVLQTGLYSSDEGEDVQKLHEEMASLGLDTTHFWMMKEEHSTENLGKWLKKWIRSHVRFLHWNSVKMDQVRREKRALEREQAIKANEIYKFIERLLEGLWFVKESADLSLPTAPSSAPTAYECPKSLLDLWPDYPRERYVYLKVVRIFQRVCNLVEGMKRSAFPDYNTSVLIGRLPGVMDWVDAEVQKLVIIPIGESIEDALTPPPAGARG